MFTELNGERGLATYFLSFPFSYMVGPEKSTSSWVSRAGTAETCYPRAPKDLSLLCDVTERSLKSLVPLLVVLVAVKEQLEERMRSTVTQRQARQVWAKKLRLLSASA